MNSYELKNLTGVELSALLQACKAETERRECERLQPVVNNLAVKVCETEVVCERLWRGQSLKGQKQFDHIKAVRVEIAGQEVGTYVALECAKHSKISSMMHGQHTSVFSVFSEILEVATKSPVNQALKLSPEDKDRAERMIVALIRAEVKAIQAKWETEGTLVAIKYEDGTLVPAGKEKGERRGRDGDRARNQYW